MFFLGDKRDIPGLDTCMVTSCGGLSMVSLLIEFIPILIENFQASMW